MATKDSSTPKKKSPSSNGAKAAKSAPQRSRAPEVPSSRSVDGPPPRPPKGPMPRPRFIQNPERETIDRRFVLTTPYQEPAPVPEFEDLGELPAAYGTRSLRLLARDPSWCYAYWDLTTEQFQEAMSGATDGKIYLHVYTDGGYRVQQIHIPEGTSNWYIHVGSPGGRFYSELGLFNDDGHFVVLARSGLVECPRDFISPNVQARYVTLPMRFSFQQLLELLTGMRLKEEDLAEALARLQATGFKFPFEIDTGAELTEDQQRALAEYLGGEVVRRIQAGSFELEEALKARLQDQLSSGVTSFGWGLSSETLSSWGLGLSSFEVGAALSSEVGASWSSESVPGLAGRERSFFMHVNAELIIYGGTDPNAKVRIDGHPIKLRDDGTFSYHFTFPDGRYFIPIEAESPDGEETRAAMLSFLRITDTVGDVAKTGQPPHLKPPLGRQG